MGQVIIHNAPDGVAVTVPTPEALAIFSIAEIAQRSVPAGRPFKIMDADDLPSAPQESWVVDDAELTDGIGGAE